MLSSKYGMAIAITDTQQLRPLVQDLHTLEKKDRKT